MGVTWAGHAVRTFLAVPYGVLRLRFAGYVRVRVGLVRPKPEGLKPAANVTKILASRRIELQYFWNVATFLMI